MNHLLLVYTQSLRKSEPKILNYFYGNDAMIHAIKIPLAAARNKTARSLLKLIARLVIATRCIFCPGNREVSSRFQGWWRFFSVSR